MSTIEEFVNQTVKDHPVAIFSKSRCPFCGLAKECFEQIGVKFHAVELDKRDDCEEIQDVLGKMTGARSVPRVFVNGRFIGGGTDVKKMRDNGELEKLIHP